MPHLAKKINQLKWLQMIGIDYYLSESNKEQRILTNFDKSPKKKIIVKTEPIARLDNRPLAKNKLQQETNKVTVSDEQSRIGDDFNNALLARFLADSATSLENLKDLLMNFDGCALKKLANNTVFADGNPNGLIMFVGEAPGNNEDIEGVPFCGESGKLLDNILSSINISRKHNAYITNTVFWRPPANRQPTQEEIAICRPFVERHIAFINPKLIIVVGNVAATSLLGKNAGISKIRQEYLSYHNQYLSKPIPTTGIFHPAYLLRQPMQKKTTWYDLIKIREFINQNISQL
jgi:DNA polymerase